MAPMRRKNNYSIRSPNVKRNNESQVTLEGWLYKLEGGTLRQFKQRWCVLADFCLFVYKGPHEEKTTSSILLPSYKISPCTGDDKFSRKFAFKAEHQNMKTYYFAADEIETMKRWMNAMSMASIMQSMRSTASCAAADGRDDESGFNSYRSKRYTSQNMNSSYNSHLQTEPLKQRSSSYGERVGEPYLRSDDKYPTSYNENHVYKSASEVSRRQNTPLYVNAPPKPKRSPHMDNYAPYPQDPDPREQQMFAAIDPVQYMEEKPYAEHRRVMEYSAAMEQSSAYPPVFEDRTGYSSEYYHQDPTPDLCQSQPIRPRSASDFVDREPEHVAMPDVAQYPVQIRQPQRPKSSLDYFNRFDMEDSNFVDYREAVRIQADNLYKHSSKPRKQSYTETPDPRLYDQSEPLPNEQVSPCYALPSKVVNLREQSPHKEHSMQRLMEWKQRMLQSPLSRKNRVHSDSSNHSSPMRSPLKPVDHQQQPRQKAMGSREAHMQRYKMADPGSYNYSSDSQHSYHAGHHSPYSHQPPSASKYRVPETVNADAFPKQDTAYSDGLENNENLLSYDDKLLMNDFGPLQTSHYPPQMHSFSTMPNVSDIGNENPEVSTFDSQSLVKSNQELDYPQRDYIPRKSTNYSSDDEASLDLDCLPRNAIKVNRFSDSAKKLPSEVHVREPNVRKLVQQSEGLMCRGKKLSVSAGDLLGKTHEELVLLLIQLRRNQTKLLRSKEKLEHQLNNMQFQSHSSQPAQPIYQNSKDLQKQIQLLENQYDVTQPLVSLVDNMVKLGSLYGSSNRRSFSLPALDTAQIEMPVACVAEQPDYLGESSILSKLLAEETNLQKCISELYSLDKGLRHETNSISSLHQDKEMLEYTLSGMRNKILDHQDKPNELQKLKKQQKMIEKELVRVKKLLSTSAKKIEDAASKNNQMEQDILYLRHILKEALKTGSTEMKPSLQTRADIEAELSRVQNVLDELANHRHEINNTVEKLTGEPHQNFFKNTEVRDSPIEEKEEKHLKNVKKEVEVRASPTGVAGSAPLPVRKKQNSMYLETDLDTMVTIDLAVVHESKELDDIPVYANAEEINSANEECSKNTQSEENMFYQQTEEAKYEQCTMQDINEADERMKRFYGILPKEKPCEIKTVRIVKRQSEKRNRDKKRVTYDDQSSVWVVEDLSSDDLLEVEEVSGSANASSAMKPTSTNLLTSNMNRQSKVPSAHERLFGSAASSSVPENTNTNRKERTSPALKKEHSSTTKRSPKRRHYTVSGYQYALDPQFSQYFKDRPRSRDDVDMERCLRTANTPDIVKSTIKKNEVFDDRIIERELMLPQKIEIPERYVEDEPEELSAHEKLQRSRKAENICKMLSETTAAYGDVVEERNKSPDALHKKLSEEKRRRAHLLNLNRAIAREVVEKSKAVAANVSDNPA